MEQASYLSNVTAFAIIAVCWIIFVATLLVRRGGSSAKHRSREPLSWFGLILQLISYPISWVVWRPPFSPFVGINHGINIGFQLLGIGIAVYSIWLVLAAFRELGQQWSLQARVLDDHELVTSGVYGLVRHPIYTAMFGMLIATGIVVSHWLALAAAVLIFLAGTKIRVHFEEKLLANAFGPEFEVWRSRVPTLIPRINRTTNAPDGRASK